jgi:hypothetical protein
MWGCNSLEGAVNQEHEGLQSKLPDVHLGQNPQMRKINFQVTKDVLTAGADPQPVVEVLPQTSSRLSANFISPERAV